MFSTLRNRFGVPGVISVIALVFAMLGGAYAASNGGGGAGDATASAKKKAKKAKRGPRGPRGAAGPVGPTGPAGPKGDAGSAGANGAPGKDGANGEDGSSGDDGVSVTATQFEGVGGPCTEGGVQFESASPEPAYACNGKPGSGSGGGPLPSEESLTGTFGGVVGDLEFGPVPIAYAIPLGASLDSAHVHFRPINSPNTECPGTASNPQASPGHLCVYVVEEAELAEKSFAGNGSGVTGTHVFIEGTPGGYIYGSWAVTAP